MWMLFDLGLLVVAVILFFALRTMHYSGTIDRYNHRKANMSNANTEMLQNKIDMYTQKLHDKTYTYDRLRGELQTLENDLNDPQYLEMQRIEFLKGPLSAAQQYDNEEFSAGSVAGSETEMLPIHSNNEYMQTTADIYAATWRKPHSIRNF